MFQPSVSVSHQAPPYQLYSGAFPGAARGVSSDDANRRRGVLQQIVRRWRRERRRRKVGRAYDMALEISREISRSRRRGSSASRVLDVGCGNGYIAHHLSAMLGASVLGIDLDETTEAMIDYRPFDGVRFPVETESLDAVLFCYVLHHAQELGRLLGEARRVLRAGGQVVVYEDIPETGWDRLICRIHDRQWRGRTGSCTFNTEAGWRRLFASAGFEVVKTRSLSRWRNLAHPVSRRFFLMELDNAGGNKPEH
jgi:SAM-dependent methyltransferase